MPKFKDLTGQKFERLTVLERVENIGTKTAWKCLCDCGNIKIVTGNNLTQGRIKSCGCLKKEKQAAWGRSTGIDLTGKHFGELTVIQRAFDIEQEKKKTCVKVHPIWKCLCSCGNYTNVYGHHLKSGNIKSCGHIFSHGNQKILNILQENDINFKKELTISYKNKVYRFDFAILDDKNIVALIEYDGFQHFYYNNQGWNTKENFEKQQIIDSIKNEYAQINNIPLLRIPYTDLDKIDFNYIKSLLAEMNIFIDNYKKI